MVVTARTFWNIAPVGGFSGGGAGYEPVTFYSEGFEGGLAAQCKPGSFELMLINSLLPKPGLRLTGGLAGLRRLSVLRPGSPKLGRHVSSLEAAPAPKPKVVSSTGRHDTLGLDDKWWASRSQRPGRYRSTHPAERRITNTGTSISTPAR